MQNSKSCRYKRRAARITAIRNITKRMCQDREIKTLNRIYAVLSKVSQAVVGATSPGQFLEQACQIVVEDGQFLLSWIGQVDEATHVITPVAAWGEARDYAKGIHISTEDCPEGRGPTGLCMRERRPIVVNDFVHDPTTLPWHSRAEHFHIRASAALPIAPSGKVWGVLMIYSDQIGFFSEKDVKLLEEVAGSIGFALSNLEKEGLQRESEVSLRRLASAVHQAAESIVITNTDAIIEYVNPAFEAVTGYASNEAMGRNPRFLQSGMHDRAFYQEMWVQISNGNAWSGRFINRRKDGRLYHEDATISPIRDEHGQIVHYVAVKRDVTRELDLEGELLQAQKLESIGLLAGGVAHDLNNLLSPILGYSEILLEDTVLSEDQRDQVGEMLEAGRRARDLVRQLMAFGRKQALETRPIDMNELISDFSKLLRRTLREEIHFSLDLTPNLPCVRADRNQMEQVLMNLAINAQDALPAGGELSIATSVVNVEAGNNAWTGELEEGLYVLLAVRDNGIGMTEDIRSRVFEPFFTTKEVGHGTGLGLATVYGIVKQHSGAIMVESAPGKGSLFRLYLPVSLEEIDKRESPLPLANAAGGSETILVAEDDPMVRAVATGILKQFGYRVLSYESPVACFEAGKELGTSIDLLLTDVVMPDMSGNELYQELSAIIPDLRVLFMSGYTGNVIAGRGMLKQGVNFIQKPFTRHALALKVREALDGLAAKGHAE